MNKVKLYLVPVMMAFLIMPKNAFAWGNCIINQIKEMVVDGQPVSLAASFDSPGFFADYTYLHKKGAYHCTNSHEKKEAYIYYGRSDWAAQPAEIWHHSFEPNRTDNKHPYLEVYCHKAIYYWYDGEWKSKDFSWHVSHMSKCVNY